MSRNLEAGIVTAIMIVQSYWVAYLIGIDGRRLFIVAVIFAVGFGAMVRK